MSVGATEPQRRRCGVRSGNSASIDSLTRPRQRTQRSMPSVVRAHGAFRHDECHMGSPAVNHVGRRRPKKTPVWALDGGSVAQ
jgi:hypothetical protein